jgi:hypothetical protein
MSVAKPQGQPQQGRDLEIIVLLLTLGAIELTPEVGSTFTFDQLLKEARTYGGPDLALDERDVRIVVPFCKFLRKAPGARYRLV